MVNSVLLARVADDVETLIAQNPIAIERFREQIKVFNEYWSKYYQAKKDEPQPYSDPTGKNGKDGYEYDPDFKMWFPLKCPPLPPDPTKWQSEDKLPCYYATLAIIYDSVKGNVAPFGLCEGILDDLAFGFMQLCISRAWGFDKDMLDTALKWVKADLVAEKPAETGGKSEGSKIMVTDRTSKDNWKAIKSEYGTSKSSLGKKINFVSDSFKREIIFRDIEHAYVLASQGYSKPALILAGGVIEELLRLYLEHKHIKPENKRFADYIKACEDNGLLKRGVYLLTGSIRDFRNLVHLEKEKTKSHTVSKATAKGAVSSIFTIAHDFQ